MQRKPTPTNIVAPKQLQPLPVAKQPLPPVNPTIQAAPANLQDEDDDELDEDEEEEMEDEEDDDENPHDLTTKKPEEKKSAVGVLSIVSTDQQK